ncbi:hypothetical protein [Aeromicrobium massiliense]|uniref:hypothetical protein n=1 Tax=Aeromicrobium massiliense TaxID=1464554 RepID=UPI00031CB30D|nr:hypothetical protein [Aeromicrobium massiliense]
MGGVTLMETEALIQNARRLSRRQRVDWLDELRSVKALSAQFTQVELASQLGVAQPTISRKLQAAAKIPAVRPGFAGGTPNEIIDRYVAGALPREDLVDQLARWEYAKGDRTDGPLDDLTFHVEGSFDDVVTALDKGLIDESIYDEVLDRIAEAQQTPTS